MNEKPAAGNQSLSADFSGTIVTSSIMSGVTHYGVTLTDCSKSVSKYAFMIAISYTADSPLLGLSKYIALYSR